MKGYLYFALVSAGALATGCAFGVTPEQELAHDSGITHLDAGTKKDANAPIDAAVHDSSQVLPDVEQTQCSSLPLQTGIPACDTCLGASCCNEDQTCGNDQECMAFDECLYECIPTDGGTQDPNCETDCATTYPNGFNELDALDTCLAQSCSTECQ